MMVPAFKQATRADRIEAAAEVIADGLAHGYAPNRQLHLLLSAAALLAADEAVGRSWGLPYALTDRLRGRYAIPVDDGCGPLDGSDVFVRAFTTPPIQQEAAAEIDRLRDLLIHYGDLAGIDADEMRRVCRI